MADALGVNVSDRAQKLVGVELDEQVWHHLLHFEILLHDAVRCVRDVVHHDIEIDFLRLVTVSVERLAHFDTVRVVQHFEDLQLSVLVSLVLEHFLDCHCLACFRNSRFENHSK